jgi:hypothetical protein
MARERFPILDPLTQLECRDYLVRRLPRAGTSVNSWKIFPDPVIAKIFEYSCGIPRLIDSIAENALISTNARQSLVVTEEIIEEVATDLRLKTITAVPLLVGMPELAAHAEAVLKKLIELLQLVASPDTSEQAAATANTKAADKPNEPTPPAKRPAAR